MDNRDAIIRKLNAIRAKANNAGTPQEAATFAKRYEELMEKYRLTETDLEIKNSTINRTIKPTPKKEISLIARTCTLIATLTDTHVMTGPKGEIVFTGFPSDIQYADWLYTLIERASLNGYNSLPLSAEYHKLLNNGIKPAIIKHNYMVGFMSAIWNTLRQMIEDRKVAGQALVVLKHGLIKTFIDNLGGTTASKDKAVKLYDNAHGIANIGFEEGSKVKLRKGVEKEEVLRLN